MTRWSLAAASFLLGALGAPLAEAAVGPLQLEFSVPAQASGNPTLDALQWMLLVFPPSSQTTFDFMISGGGSITNHTYSYAAIDRDEGNTMPPMSKIPQEPESFEESLSADLAFRGSSASLFVQADHIRFMASEAKLGIERADGAHRTHEYLPAYDAPSRAYRHNLELAPDGLAMPIQASQPNGTFAFTVEIQGIRKMEWSNAQVDCRSAACPDGANAWVTRQPLPGNGIAWAGTLSYTEVQATSGTARGSGSALLAAAGGPTVYALVDGWARFPDASLTGDCGGQPCEDPAGRTFQAQGRVVLADLAAVPGTRDRVQSSLQGELATAYFDETRTPALTTAAVGGAAAVALAVLVKVLALFARNTRPLLEHPKTKALHDLVLGRPGVSFSNLKETTGWGHGTVHYHLHRLLKAGMVVAYGYRNSVRYFENHGRHQHDWQEHAAFQKPELRRLHEWIAAHPRSSQSRIVKAAAEWGWKRSTTRHYLGILQAARLVQDERSAPNVVEYVARRLQQPVP